MRRSLLCRLGRHRWSERFYLFTGGRSLCGRCGAIGKRTWDGSTISVDGLSPEQIALVKQGWEKMARRG